jgi:membrane peptidoglycan carboxypeptidase
MLAVKVVKGVFLLALTALLSIAALLGASAFKWAGELPDLSELDVLGYSATSQVFARDGRLIGEILPAAGEGRETTNRIPVSLNEVSPAALMAIVAYEDDQFFSHYGFDIPSLLRATYEEFLGDTDRGGSTITTQVIKNTVLAEISTDRSLERKAKEVMLAVELERRLTKGEILQRYINVIFWGGNVYGIRAAAQAYFEKDPIELSLAEGLYLARLIPAPNNRHDDFTGTRASMKQVLDRMVSKGRISRELADAAWLEELVPRGWRITYDGAGNVVSAEQTGEEVVIRTTVSGTLSKHVMLAVRNWLTERYGREEVFGKGGFKVYTTIDVQAQEAANTASLRGEVPAGAQLAIVGLDPATGEILAMVGEKLHEGQEVGDLNRVTQSLRQPGSSFKPIVFATAIEQGTFTQATVLMDEPTVFRQGNQPPWEPGNADHLFEGAATVRQHMDHSRNIPAVKALEAATAQAVAQRARELGYQDVEPYYSIALGTLHATPLQHAAAFAAFANGGLWVEPHLIQRIEDADGNVLFQANPREAQVWSPQTAYIMLDMLHGNVVDRGPTAYSWRAGEEEMAGRWVAGKTGTTNEDRDIWFVGATPGMVSAVWIGNDDNRVLPGSMTLSSGASDTVNSSRQPIYVWRDFVANALRGKSTSGAFPVPEGIVFENFDRITGRPSSGGTRGAFSTSSELADMQPVSSITIEVAVDERTGLRAGSDTPFDSLAFIRVAPEELYKYLP